MPLVGASNQHVDFHGALIRSQETGGDIFERKEESKKKLRHWHYIKEEILGVAFEMFDEKHSLLEFPFVFRF